uniref:Non-specific serine/threonine protein kinase n=1 Tax=Trichobilharzia regenti TaxID=157069 RepID=A0AA85J469_TRIRE|nr:unnamed protein product [Trichobilharzia regenti]
MWCYLWIFFTGFHILTAFYPNTVCCASENKEYEYVHPVNKIPNDSYILVHTVGGDLLCVHRRSGSVKWKLHSVSALSAAYHDGPMLVVDPISGSLYEYASAVSDFLFHQLEHSIMGHVRRSPAYYKNFLSLGSKSDYWISVDMNTGNIIESVFQDYVDKCPTSLNTGNINTLQNSTEQQADVINLGRTQYNLVLRDRFTGSVKLNITYNTFASHTGADLQNYDLQHVAITQPALLTFEGSKLIWSLPLSSPVIGLYAVWSLPDSSSSIHTVNENSNNNNNDNYKDTINTHTHGKDVHHHDAPDESNFNPTSDDKESVRETVKLPRILRRIAFTTYALDLENTSHLPDDQIYDVIEAKFNGTLDFAPSLYVGRSKSAPVYAFICVAESTLRLRGLRRASEMYMLEGPKNLNTVDNNRPPRTETYSSSDHKNNDNIWPNGLIGLYELPASYNRPWVNNAADEQFMHMRERGGRLKRLSSIPSDASTMWAVIVPPPSPLENPSENLDTSETSVSQDSSSVIDVHNKKMKGSSYAVDSRSNTFLFRSHWFFWSISLLFTILCVLTALIFFLNIFVKSSKIYNMTYGVYFENLFRVFEATQSIFSKLFMSHVNESKAYLVNSQAVKVNPPTETHSVIPGFLPCHFDIPNSDGWAGCSAQEAGQPEPIRINLNKVLGQGANGTMVFAGTYGPHETAVKRIVRHPLLEKHWRREHAILLQHQHPHLVRCYWTGSTANFHYLVMQRCALSLNEALFRSSTISSTSDSTNTTTNPIKRTILDDLGLTPVEIIRQFILAVACLHRNHIVHRDLKPSNILITIDNNNNINNNNNNNNNNTDSGNNQSIRKARIVVGDFGLSRPLSTDEQQADTTLNSFGPHISVKIQQMKNCLSVTNDNNNNNNGCTDDTGLADAKQLKDGNNQCNADNNANVYGICVRYGDQKQPTTTATTTDTLNGKENKCDTDNSVCFTFGTLGWMAPELCDTESAAQVKFAIDIFACGLLAFYVLTHGKHPYDRCDKESSEFRTENSTQSSTSSSSSSRTSLSSSVINTNTNTGSTNSGNENKSFRCTSLSRQHERQLAIAERCEPNLSILTENSTNVCESYLSRYLIQTMLSSDPDSRPTAEEITYYPLFWSPNKVIRFFSEVSDVMDVRDCLFDCSSRKNTIHNDGGSVDRSKLNRSHNISSGNNNNKVDNNNSKNQQNAKISPCRQLTKKRFNEYHCQQMVSELDCYTHWIFNKHWFSRLEPELVHDLLSTRGYQDTSALYLLRAIRNKRNHIWSLPENIRAIFGHNHEGMAAYWTSRFPALLPLTYGLCNKHFTGNANFAEFLPPTSVSKVFVGAPVNCPWWPIWNTDDNSQSNETSVQTNNETNQSSSDGRQTMKSDSSVWKRGEVVCSYSAEYYKQYDKPPNPLKTTSMLTTKSSDIHQEEEEDRIHSSEIDPSDENSTEGITTTTDAAAAGSGNRRRRRPNQPKKIRPCKKQISMQRRESMLAIAGSELPFLQTSINKPIHES